MQRSSKILKSEIVPNFGGGSYNGDEAVRDDHMKLSTTVHLISIFSNYDSWLLYFIIIIIFLNLF